MSDSISSPTSAVPLLARRSRSDLNEGMHLFEYNGLLPGDDRSSSRYNEKLDDGASLKDDCDTFTIDDLEALDKGTRASRSSEHGLRRPPMRRFRMRLMRRPVLLVAATALLLGAVLGVLYISHMDRFYWVMNISTSLHAPVPEAPSDTSVPQPQLPQPKHDLADGTSRYPEGADEEKRPTAPAHSEWALGPPTESFRDNLRNDTKYITSWIAAGWTNDFMTYANLLYLAVLTDRVAVLPPFAPSHLGSSAGFIHVGDVFDLPRLSQLMHGHPIIEWRDLKLPESTLVDPLGCWSIWSTVVGTNEDRHPRENPIERLLSLDVSYTPVPTRAIMYPQIDNDYHTRFGDLAAIAFPDGRRAAHLPQHAPFPSPGGHTALPDEHMACYDFPYYVSEVEAFEFYHDYSPMWRFVGRHAHFTPRLEALGRDVVRQTLGLGEGADLPPFVSVHVRRGDFKVYCDDGEGGIRPGCFATLSAFARRVRDVQEELHARRGIEASEVLVTSDESSEDWWAEVEALGWRRMNHHVLRTEERLGRWYTVLLDAVVQSLGVGFVGTDQSTMSLIARRRVVDWNNGIGVDVRWGSEGADDH